MSQIEVEYDIIHKYNVGQHVEVIVKKDRKYIKKKGVIDKLIFHPSNVPIYSVLYEGEEWTSVVYESEINKNVNLQPRRKFKFDHLIKTKD